MALASRLAGPDYAVPSLPGSDSWLSKRNKKNPEVVPARLGAVKLHFRCCRNILDLVVNKHASITVGLVTRLWLCLTVSPVWSTQSIYSRSLYATGRGICMTCDSACNGKSHRGPGGAPSNSSLMLFEKVNFRATTPAPVIVRATFSWPICLLFFVLFVWKLSEKGCHRFFYSFPANSGDETKSGYVVKHLFLYVSKYLARLTFELWNSVATFCR